ncbi:MAG TPA: DUF1501 domain-containing protein [Gemmataceae bacterium]|nr:DUF1501 domain-containing protein [Gemmataceae bacterium]
MLHRRALFQFGGVSLLSGGLLHMLAAQDRPQRRRAKSCILLFQVGGPYQAETFDPKPDASAEIRGIYQTIATRVTGLRMTDALPRVAEQADKIAILRGLNHTIRCHNPAIYCSLVGREATDPMAVSNRTAARRTDHPHFASVAARLRPPRTSMPFHVIIPNTTNNGPSKSPGLLGGYLGAAYDPFVLGADPADADFRVESTVLPDDVNAARFDSRQSLLARFDQDRRHVERNVDAMHTHYQRAFNMLTAPESRAAFDLSRESDRVRDRYGRHTQGQSALLARRLVEAGVPFVSVFSHVDVDRGSWDTHQNHNARVRDLLPPADQSFSALLEDLAARGMLDETLVIWMGEFGRTPRMGVNFSNNTNNTGGRDHWCNCYSVVLAGGGVRGGNVVGSSDQFAAYPRERAVHVSELQATIFHLLGIDPRATLYDIQGQFHTICDGNPVMELF